MNVAYLLKVADTKKLSELVELIEMPPLDMNLYIREAESRGEIRVDFDKDEVELLVDPEPASNEDLKDKIFRTIKLYAQQGTIASRGRIVNLLKDPGTGLGYAWHDYVMTVQHLIDEGSVVEIVTEVPEKAEHYKDKKGRNKKKILRPARKFAFLGLPGDADKHEEWIATSVNEWIKQFEDSEI